MSKVQILRLLVSVPKVSRLTTCHFCVSNRLETNARRQSVFERYVKYQIENKVPLNYGKAIEEDEEVKNKLESSPTVEGIEQSDKTDGLGHSRSSEKNRESLKVNETVSDELKTKTHNTDEEQVNISENNNVTQPNKNVQYEDKNLKILRNSVSNQDSESVVKRYKKPTPIKIDYSTAKPHFKYILDCELMSDVDATINSEEYLLFHEHLEKNQIMSFLPSVTHILREVESGNNQILDMWRTKQIEKLGEEGFQSLMKVKKNLGVDFHQSIYRYLSGEKSIEIPPELKGQWRSIIHVLDSLQEDDIKMLEGRVCHPLLHYRGAFDCIAVYRNTLCIIEWKTSNMPKPFLSTLYNYPIQAAAYLGAVNTSFELKEKLGPVTNAVIVIAYHTGQPAHAHFLNDTMVEVYWKKWLEMVYIYWSKQTPNKVTSYFE